MYAYEQNLYRFLVNTRLNYVYKSEVPYFTVNDDLKFSLQQAVGKDDFLLTNLH